MVVYHGGLFVYADDDNIVGYTEGLCDTFKEAEIMSIMDLDNLCEKLGYEEHAFYWYVTPGKSIENGLVKLKVHDDITRMLKELGGDRNVTVLFEHFRGVNRRKAPGEGSSIPVEEEEVVTAGYEGLREQEGVEEIEDTIHTKDVDDKDAWSSNSDSSTEFDDDFEEPEYMETFDKEVEGEGGINFDEANTDVEEQNEEPEVNDADLDVEQKQALRELRRLNRKRKSQRTKFRPNYDLYDGVSKLKEVQLEVGQVFASSQVFKEAAKEYAIRCGRVIWFPCNEKGRVKGSCKGKKTNCPWSIWASKYEKNSDAFMIKTLNDKHTCPWINKNRYANSTWLSRRYTKELRPG
ncbi:hypothetical protein LWI29_004594 [Acer saccharum]|uniref:Transposase MuDR plant domain-containing protein n=1 Tax=Acer saccharum TaxID=4024 RepID=A0AA39SRG1_ACESA|nr:hypothetical protein LWI29_004594 [Acer saccharum]